MKTKPETKHTPGPLTMMESNCACKFTWANDGKTLDVEYCAMHGAAMDLLEAVKALRAVGTLAQRTPRWTADHMADAAIAKAEGR